MITIPFPLFAAIAAVLIVGFTWDFGKYIRITSIILYLGFWLSFDASGTPPFLESLFSTSDSVFDSEIDSQIWSMFKPMLYLFGTLIFISVLYICLRAYFNREKH